MGRLILVGWIVLIILGLGLFIGFEVYTHLILGFTLKEQAGFLLLPKSVDSQATATNLIAIKLKGRIDAEVPFKQDLKLPLHGTYLADIALDTQVPLKFMIHYQGVVPINTFTDIQGTTELVTGRHWFLPKFKLRTKIPLNFNLPISLTVPVDTHIRFVYAGPLTLQLNQTVTSPIDTILRTYLMVDREVKTPVLASFGLRLYPPQAPTPVLVDADLRLPLRSLQLKPAAHEQ